MGEQDMNSNICSTINTSIADSVNRQDEVLNGSGPLESKIGQHGINAPKSVPQFATEQKKDEFADAAIENRTVKCVANDRMTNDFNAILAAVNNDDCVTAANILKNVFNYSHEYAFEILDVINDMDNDVVVDILVNIDYDTAGMIFVAWTSDFSAPDL